MPLSKILGAAAVITLTATATFAFTGPTNAPGSADSSAGSMLYQMAGSSFNTSTDSLEAIRDKIDSMPFTFSSSNVGIGKTPSRKLDVNGNISASRVYGVQWGDISGRPSGLDDGDQVGLTSVSWSQITGRPSGLDDGDDVGLTSVSWSQISGRPSGLDDGDNVGITSESDPTVPASVKDGIAWGEISGRPAGLDDGDDVGVTTLGQNNCTTVTTPNGNLSCPSGYYVAGVNGYYNVEGIICCQP